MNTISIVFEFTTQYGVYRDALYLPDDHGFSAEQIAEMQRERLNNWIAIIEAPPPVEEASVEGAAQDA